LRISQLGEHPPPAIPMGPIAVEQRFCARMSLRMSLIGNRAKLGAAMQLIGVQ
jgi:hypothetical protein